MILYLTSAFNSAHFYNQPAWTEAKNLEVFGRCHTAFGHGHNYRLEVGFHVTHENYKVEQAKYQRVLNTLTSRLDHEHLNFVIPEFKDLIPTTENIALYFLEKLKAQIPEDQIASVKLNETDSIWTEILL